MSRESLFAVTLPAEHPTVPDRAQFHKWAPYTSSTPSKGDSNVALLFLGNPLGRVAQLDFTPEIPHAVLEVLKIIR